MGRLFGTDGIRGKANQEPITADTALRVGRAVACHFQPDAAGNQPAHIVIGQDTRISGDMLAHALAAGIASAGVDVHMAGVLPTPGVAFVTRQKHALAGIVVSASHNPFDDNGIKVFDSDGRKLSDTVENELEKRLLHPTLKKPCPARDRIGRVIPLQDAFEAYVDFLVRSFPADLDLADMRIAVDCSNGATSQAAPLVLGRLGAEVVTIFAEPDGVNINRGCGSKHPGALAQTVRDRRAAVGLAFDGDGDRLIAVDADGQILSGDQILAICARFLKQKGRLSGDVVVSTVMSNIGLQRALQALGIRRIETDVGDRWVMQAMAATGAILGGEDSGHLIFADRHTTGDGLLAALRLLEAMRCQGKPLSTLASVMTVFPQVLVNVDVAAKPELEALEEVQATITAAEKELGAQGRVLVRYSGTQPQCRVMVEAPTDAAARTYARQIADTVIKAIGR